MTTPALPLPGGYWWSDQADRSVLFLRYGWAATVTATETEIRGAGGRRLHGRCGSVAQGKRFVERWVLGQAKGTYRRWKALWSPLAPYVPTRADRSCAALRSVRGAPSQATAAVGAAVDEEWESWVWRADVPFDEVRSAIDR